MILYRVFVDYTNILGRFVRLYYYDLVRQVCNTLRKVSAGVAAYLLTLWSAAATSLCKPAYIITNVYLSFYSG